MSIIVLRYLHHKFSINLITFSGNRENGAIKIDAALKCFGDDYST
jgi:hypothetical protein